MSQQKQFLHRDKYINAENEAPEYYRRAIMGAKKEEREEEAKYWANIEDEYMLQPIYGGDGRVLVKIDGYISKYSCTACLGTGHTDELCPMCKGEKVAFDGVAKSMCRACCVGVSDGKIAYGYKLCPQCNGKQGTIIIPDISQKNTDSGDVLAISRVGINELKPGMKVLIATYSGIPFKFMDIDFKIMVEKDVLGIMKKLKKVTEGMNQSSYADLENLGVPRE